MQEAFNEMDERVEDIYNKPLSGPQLPRIRDASILPSFKMPGATVSLARALLRLMPARKRCM